MDQFADFDNETVYTGSLVKALSHQTLNFVVEFGKNEAWIAFDQSAEAIQTLVTEPSKASERPVRWINLWAPNRQRDLVNVLGKYYKFSPRLLALILSDPPASSSEEERPQRHARASRLKHAKNDVETASRSLHSSQSSQETVATNSLPRLLGQDHYGIASRLYNYQSIDVGPRFLCIGANWMHELHQKTPGTGTDNLLGEGRERRVWSWIILCDDNTVISLHEDTQFINHAGDVRSIRSNTVSVLSQISRFGHASASPISMQTVRQVLVQDDQIDPGREGASNLFYYLFDDWRSVFMTVARFRLRLENLQSVILNDMTKRSSTSNDIRIIPRLHNLGRQIRQMQNLYAAYRNLIERILEPNFALNQYTETSMTNVLANPPQRSVVLAQSAALRFERLADRIKLLVLSETEEFLAEKDALISTYFNINAQKDSEATARLNRSAALLAKLSVFFLPISLLTSYFSTEIQELQSYTAKDYWYSFAVLVSISFLSLFWFGKALVSVTDWLDTTVKGLLVQWIRKIKTLCGARRRDQNARESDDGEEK